MNTRPRQRRNLDSKLEDLRKIKKIYENGEKGFRHLNRLPGFTIYGSLIELFDWIDSGYLDEFTPVQEETMEHDLDSTISSLKSGADFNPDKSVLSNYDDLLKEGSKLVVIAERVYGGNNSRISALKNELTFKRFFEKVKRQAVLAEKSAEKAKEAEVARQILLREGVGESFEHYFENESETHLKQSRRWLKSTIWWSILGFLGAIAFAILYRPEFKTIEQAILPIFQKLLIVSIYFFVLSLMVKNYNASRHNYVVNKHRQLVIDSALALRALSGDKTAVGDMLLSHAVEAACGMQTSGYLSKEDKIGIPISGITKTISDAQSKQ